MKVNVLQAMVAVLVSAGAQAQVDSGSDGHDGAFNPTTNTVINMADHPDGIYHYSEVNIPGSITVSFIPNAANTPVVWLVQGSCVINGIVVLNGQQPQPGVGGKGGAGGFDGGNGGGGAAPPGDGRGPGGGRSSSTQSWMAGNASFATLGGRHPGGYICNETKPQQDAPGDVYGNKYLLPMIGGSGGGGIPWGLGGAGGGGAILIAATNITHNGSIQADGGSGNDSLRGAGGGSGGGIRLVATYITGGGSLSAGGGSSVNYYCWGYSSGAGSGRVRLDALANSFIGNVSGDVSRGYQPIIIPPPNQAVSLGIQSVGGVTAPANPTASPTAPDVVMPGAQQNPVSIVVRCVNIPLNTEIIVEVKPANGPTIRTVGINSTGTQASSTATVSVTMPRGAGTIQAKCVSGIAGTLGASLNQGEKFKNYAQTGLTADGEVFAKMEITATLGRGQEIAYITESGKRYSLPSR